jgi:hypothetical protein
LIFLPQQQISFPEGWFYFFKDIFEGRNKKEAHHYWQASPFCFVARLPNTLTIPLRGE